MVQVYGKNTIMKYKIYLFCVLGVLLMSSTCSKENDTELFKTPYEGSELNLTGYFITNLNESIEGELKSTYFFYQDGVVLYGRSYPISMSENEIEGRFVSTDFDGVIKQSKSGWGIFVINEGELEFETWEPSSGGSLKTVVRSGSILNDSTFLITSFYNGYSEETTVKNDTFRFKSFSPKPDSTNMFVQ